MNELSEVVCVPEELDAERTGHGGFRLSGVRARGLPCVATPDTERTLPVEPQKHGGDTHEEGTDARRDEIADIVEAGSRGAEVLILVVLVADHGVHGVDGFIEPATGHTENHHEQERCYHPVGSILRDRLDRRLRDTGHVETLRVATDNHGDRIARILDVFPLEGFIDLHGFPLQLLHREHLVGEEGVDRPGQGLAEHRRDVMDDERDDGEDDEHQHDEDGPRELLLSTVRLRIIRNMKAPAQELLQPLDTAPHRHHRMEPVVRIPEHQIDDQRHNQNHDSLVHATLSQIQKLELFYHKQKQNGTRLTRHVPFCMRQCVTGQLWYPEGRQWRHSTPRPVKSKPGTLSGTRPSAIAEFS